MARRGAILGAKSMRMNSPQALGPSIRPQAVRDPATGYPKNDEIMPLLGKAIESYKEMADYGGKLGIRVTLENHWGLAADPINIRIIIDEVNHPYCEASPDFCNWEYDYMLVSGLKALAPYAHTNVHAKYWDRWGDKNDVQRSVRIMLAPASRERSRSSTKTDRSTASRARSISTRKFSRRSRRRCQSRSANASGHSSRRATAGSTRVALHAGTAHAAIAVASSERPTSAKTGGSVGRTSKSSDPSERATMSAPTRPAASPMIVRRSPSVITSCSTRRRRAPSASRTPISRRRCSTEYEITP